MMTKPLTKKQLLKLIHELQSKPGDRVRILGDLGITAVGGTLSMAAAGTVAALAGATSIPVLTTAASWAGLTFVAATPVGWLLGAAAAGGAVFYGISRLIHGGGLSEGRRAELLLVYQQQVNELRWQDAQTEGARLTTPAEKNRFIAALGEIVDKGAITPTRAFDLIQQVESGHIGLQDAYRAVMDIVQDGSQ